MAPAFAVKNLHFVVCDAHLENQLLSATTIIQEMLWVEKSPGHGYVVGCLFKHVDVLFNFTRVLETGDCGLYSVY